MDKDKAPGTAGFEVVQTPNGEEQVPVIYTEKKDTIVLYGITDQNRASIFMSSGRRGYYRSDWYGCAGVFDSADEARKVIDEYYKENPMELLRAFHNSMSPDKI